MRKNLICASLAALLLLTGCAENPLSADTIQSTESASIETGAITTEPATTQAPTTESAELGPKALPTVNDDIPEIPGYTMIWNDEFDGDALDESLWNYDTHVATWSDEENQSYTDSADNVFLRDGALVLKAIKDDERYTSGKLTTQGKQSFTYGKVVFRAKVPEGKGLASYVGLLPQNENVYGPFPKCGKLDVMSIFGKDTATIHTDIYYGEPLTEQAKSFALSKGSFSEEYHEFSIEWEPSEIRWYVDGAKIHSVNDWFTRVTESSLDAAYPAPFDQPFYVTMNLAVGGSDAGTPSVETDFDKAEFEIDYIRVYRKNEYDTNVERMAKHFRQADESGNFVHNGDFSAAEDLNDAADWSLLLFDGGEATAAIDGNTLTVNTANAGKVDYSVQIVQPEIPMMRSRKYRLSFDAWADEERQITTCVSAPDAVFARYLEDQTFTVTPEKTNYTFDFYMINKDDANGRLEFNLGNAGSTAAVHFQNVRVELVD
jgi:beta-glucanase (GH16 family)